MVYLMTKFFWFSMLFFSSITTNALELEVLPNTIEFDDLAKPITLTITISDNGQPLRWDSRALKGLSSKITVLNTYEESLGRNSSFGLRFMPIGTVDGFTYRLVGTVDRSIQTETNFPVEITIADEPTLRKTVIVRIPASRSPITNTQSLILPNNITPQINAIKSDIAEIQKDISYNIVFWGVIVGCLVGIIFLFFSFRKSNSITADDGETTRRQQSESHNSLMLQGVDILASTKLVDQKSEELIRVTSRIDNDFRDFSKNPEQYGKQVEKDLSKLKKLVSSISTNSKSSNSDLSDWISAIANNNSTLEQKVEEMSQIVNSFTSRTELYDEHTLRLYDYIVGLTHKQEDEMRQRVKQATEEHLNKMGITRQN